MNKYFRKIADIRPGELGITMLMLTNIVFLLVTYYFLKPLRDTEFLKELGSDKLPLVFILTALASAPIITLYSRASRILRLPQLINFTLFLIVACLIGFYFLLPLGQAWVPYAFYTWVSIYGALVTSQFWLLANGVFTAAQAKRVFPFLGLGAIFGAWAGGEMTKLIANQLEERALGLENLLLFCVAFLLGSTLLNIVVTKKRAGELRAMQLSPKKRVQKRESMLEMYRSIIKSRHLTLVIVIISLTMMVASFVDFQFKAIASNAFETKAELTAFFGQFYGRLSLASFLLQLFFSYSILRRLGVGGIILFLPIGLLLGSVTMFLAAGLVAGVVLRGADGALKYSLDKTGRELLFLPIPLELKKKTKMFIDLFVDRWFRGVAGGLIILCIWLFGFDKSNPLATMPQFSMVVVGFLLIWIVMAFIMRKEYVNTFRRALERRTIDPSEIRISVDESATVDILSKSLKSGNPRETAYALDMLNGVEEKSLIEPVAELLDHREADIRVKAIRLLQNCDGATPIDRVRPLLNDSDAEVRREAFYFIYLHADDRAELLKSNLDNPDPRVRTAAMTCLAEYGTDQEKRLISSSALETILKEHGGDREVRADMARVLGGLKQTEFRPVLKRLLEDEDADVVREAMAASGRIKDREFVPFLIGQLASKEVRAGTRMALADYGVGVLGTLKDHLLDSGVDLTVRRHIPRVLATIPDQQTVNLLAALLKPRSNDDYLAAIDPRLRFSVVKALNGLRARHAELNFDDHIVDKVLISETRDYYETLSVLHLHKMSVGDEATELLEKALRERQEQNMERIFRLLGLAYPPEDIYSAYLGIVSDQKVLKDNAIEFLDNLLSADLKKYLIPIVDEVSAETTIKRGRELFGTKLRSRDDALSFLMDGHDVWLKACAIFAAGPDASAHLRERIEKARKDSDSLIRETAELIHSQSSEDN